VPPGAQADVRAPEKLLEAAGCLRGLTTGTTRVGAGTGRAVFELRP